MSAFEKELTGCFTPVYKKLADYGFTNDCGVMKFEKDIMDGQFLLTVIVKDEAFETELTESDTGEPYTLYKADGVTGKFNGRIRTEITEILNDIKLKCCDRYAFKSDKTRFISEYAKQKYGDELEFLWEKFPDNAVLRRKDTNKWYAAVLTVNLKKLGLDEDKDGEILLIRGDVKNIDNQTVFIGWHMNKKSWISMVLDERSDDKKLTEALDLSYTLAIK